MAATTAVGNDKLDSEEMVTGVACDPAADREMDIDRTDTGAGRAEEFELRGRVSEIIRVGAAEDCELDEVRVRVISLSPAACDDPATMEGFRVMDNVRGATPCPEPNVAGTGWELDEAGKAAAATSGLSSTRRVIEMPRVGCVTALVTATVPVDEEESTVAPVVRRESEITRAPEEEAASGALIEEAAAGEELFASTGAVADEEVPEVRPERENTRTGATTALPVESATFDEGTVVEAEGAARRVIERVRTPAAAWTASETGRLSGTSAASPDAGAPEADTGAGRADVLELRLGLRVSEIMRVGAAEDCESDEARVSVISPSPAACDEPAMEGFVRDKEMVRAPVVFEAGVARVADDGKARSAADWSGAGVAARREMEMVREPILKAAAGAGAASVSVFAAPTAERDIDRVRIGAVEAEFPSEDTRFNEIETGRERLDALVGDEIDTSPVDAAEVGLIAAAMLILCGVGTALTEAAATFRLIFRARRDDAGSAAAAAEVDEAAAEAAASFRSSFGRIEGARGGTSDGVRSAACVSSPSALICVPAMRDVVARSGIGREAKYQTTADGGTSKGNAQYRESYQNRNLSTDT